MWSANVNRQLWLSSRRNISSTVAVSANHYDVLGIHPKSTQAEVKAAYYKLSKLHHPDIADKKMEGTEKFRLITEAYEVLGNYKTRQLYDRGMYNHGSSPQIKKAAPVDPKESFYRSRFDKERVPIFGKRSIYNFDEWTKQHYSESFDRVRIVKAQKLRRTSYSDDPQSRTGDEGFIAFSVTFIILVTTVMYLTSNHSTSDIPSDVVATRNRPEDKPD